MPYYWKRGLCAGLAIGAIMSFLVHRIDPALTVVVDQAATTHPTPFGPLMGVIIFALFCVMPGPIPDVGKPR